MKRSVIIAGLMMLLGGCERSRNYAQGCGPPPANWITPRQGKGVLSTLNVISVASNGTVNWNKAKVPEATLVSYLKEVRGMNPVPVTQIQFEPGVGCDRVLYLRRLVSERLDCGYGKCAEGNGRWWEIGDVGPPFVAYDPRPDLPQDQ
ncbi:hypothetical protein U1769_12615 [Sphingomonas sp. ZT3P38]|uniref:hypothetical protein n=1 Tax=Parasphingomonas zepuensis TaxID=3096161 RepID=UPI002FC92F36